MENVLILGDARLLEVSEVIDIAELGGSTGPFRSVEESRQNISDDLGKWRWELAMQDCAAALSSFRAKHGYGRAISAVQVGHPLRLIFFDLGEEYGPMYGDQFAKPFAMINPELHNLSGESRSVNDEIDIDSADKTTVQSSFTMWDDCLSLPNMMVLVRRSTTCDVSFLDIHGIKHVWRKLPLPLAELLQHEFDHLNGILAIERKVEHGIPLKSSIITREDYLRDKVYYDSLVDYSIQ